MRKGVESLSLDSSCTPNKTNVRICILFITFLVLLYVHSLQIHVTVTAMHYPEKGSLDKGGLQIAAIHHYHSQSRGAQERQTHTETQERGQR